MSDLTLDKLPDIVLLKIFSYLKIQDILNLAEVSPRFEAFCYDRAIQKKVNCEGCYFVNEDKLKSFISKSPLHIQRLNFNHCYWLPQRSLQLSVSKCKNLRQLWVIECKLKIEHLVALIASLPQLSDLAFSISSFTEIKKDVFTAAETTLKSLRRLHIYYKLRELSVMSYIGQHTTLLDYCVCLEQLRIGSADISIPELYRPIITDPHNHCNLNTMCITSNIHAGAQMLFYGTLSQLPNAEMHWKTLLMPNVNFVEFSRKTEFKDCLKSLDNLEDLDISNSKAELNGEFLKFASATQLRHLNVRQTYVCSEHLHAIAISCLQLKSLNLFGCKYIFCNSDDGGLDFSGLEALLSNCSHLQHLNIGGEHRHITSITDDLVTKVLSKIKGLHSLCVPTCMLREPDECSSRSVKRTICGRASSRIPAKKQCPEANNQTQGADSSLSPATHRANQPNQVSSHGCSTDTQPSCDGCSKLSVMHLISENNAELRHLEIISISHRSVFHKNGFVSTRHHWNYCAEDSFVTDAALEPVSKLTLLRSLTIIGLPGIKGDSILKIAKGCTLLERLSIGFVEGAMRANVFANSVLHFKNLRDLRIEDNHLVLNTMFFGNLSQCSRLQRLCIIAKNSVFHSTDVIRLMEQLQQLVVLQMFTAATLSLCRNLTTTLNKRFIKSRPALSITIFPFLYDGISDIPKNIPAKHFDELTRFSVTVCSEPPGD